MRAAGRIIVPQDSGSVINISSIRGFSPNPGRMTYSVPKAAVIMMTKIAAGEWAPHGVRINAIAPGVLRTPMWDTDVARGAIDEQFYLDVVPMHRLGTRRRSASSPSTCARTMRPTSRAACSRSTAPSPRSPRDDGPDASGCVSGEPNERIERRARRGGNNEKVAAARGCVARAGRA